MAPHCAARIPRLGRSPLLVVLLLGLLAGALVVGRVAGADPVDATCGALAHEHAADLPEGWTLECAPGFPQGWPADEHTGAMSHRPHRRIVVRDGQDATTTRAAIVHEIAHAEASDWPREVRIAFAHAVGEQTWTGSGGPASPVEVFAESSVRCRGLPTDLAHPLVPCELVEAARAAGGFTTPLAPAGDQNTR